MNVSGAISSFLTGSYTVTRKAAGTYVNGKLVLGATTAVTIQASVQELSGRDLERLPEGLSAKRLLKVYTTTELKMRSEGHEPDLIAIDDEVYQVEDLRNWSTLGGYYLAIVSLKGAA